VEQVELLRLVAQTDLTPCLAQLLQLVAVLEFRVALILVVLVRVVAQVVAAS
jgi:hypothetical protein